MYDWARSNVIATTNEKIGIQNVAIAQSYPDVPGVSRLWLSTKSPKIVGDRGMLGPVIGTVLLKSELDSPCKLTAIDAMQTRDVEWGLPSPRLAKKYLENPHSRNAKFRVEGLVVTRSQPAEIFLVDSASNRHLLFKIRL